MPSMAKQHHAGFPTDADSDHLIHASFNQDAGRFSIGTDRGFRIYNCDPFREVYRRYFDLPGGIGKVEVLFRSHILALVSGRDNKVMIWDDHQSRCVAELSFRSEIRGVRLRRDLVAVALEHKIVLHNFADLIKMSQIETIDNPKGLFGLSQAAESLVLVCPGLQKGQLRVEHYLSIKRTKFIQAHNSSIASLAISQDGQWVATASTKGTIVRIFNTLDGTLLQELRRGMERADIFSLAFSQDCQWLAVSSCKGTVHVFGIKSESDRSETEVFSRSSSGGLMSSLSFVKGVLPKYFSSEWSVAQFRLPEGCHEYIVAFGQEKNTVVILGCEGSFYRCKFDPSTRGEMALMEHHNFLKPEDSF